MKKLRELLEESRRGNKRQAAPFSKGPPKAKPKTPGRKAGADYGVKAHREVPPEVDETYDAPLPGCCPDCGGPLDAEGVCEQYQTEMPRKPIRRKFNIGVGRCRKCGRRVQGRHPLQTSDAVGAAASQLGPDAQAVAVHLNKDLGLSHGKVARFFSEICGIPLSRGGSAQVMLRAADRVEKPYRRVLVDVRKSRENNVDETGWKVGGILQWLWGFVTRTAIAYVIRPSRGFDVPAEVLGPDYDGLLGHDGWGPYDSFKKARHQQCLFHFLVRCRELLETARGAAVLFPRSIKTLLLDSIDLRDRRDEGKVSPHGLAVATGRLQARLDRLVGPIKTNPDNERFAKHLEKHGDEIFTFLKQPAIEPTNRLGEQAMRPAVVNRKVWGGSRTQNGAEAQGRLLTILQTCVKRAVDAVDYLSRALRAPPDAVPEIPAMTSPT
ncbi:MAG: IS66 family transposase [Planctomycetes bacterium]|nr:IS66 family transposase [Planctomycetota bacterium]